MSSAIVEPRTLHQVAQAVADSAGSLLRAADAVQATGGDDDLEGLFRDRVLALTTLVWTFENEGDLNETDDAQRARREPGFARSLYDFPVLLLAMTYAEDYPGTPIIEGSTPGPDGDPAGLTDTPAEHWCVYFAQDASKRLLAWAKKHGAEVETHA